MKKKVNQFKQQIDTGTQDHTYVLKGFSRILDDQVTPGDLRFLIIYTFDFFLYAPSSFVTTNLNALFDKMSQNIVIWYMCHSLEYPIKKLRLL